MMQSSLATGGFVLAASFGLLVSTAFAQCCGDCNGDGAVDVTELITAVNSALGACPGCVTRAQILATGQSKCWDSSGNEIPCAGTGQEGDLHQGAVRTYSDNGDGTITDNATGLMWEAKDDNNAGGVHDKDNTYTWDAAFAFVRGLNQVNLAGYNDWRLPNRFELESLLNLGVISRVAPAVDPAFNNAGCVSGCVAPACSCIARNYYWTSNTYTPTGSEDFAWYVYFGDASTSVGAKSTKLYVRAVRSAVVPGCALGQPACSLPSQ